MNENRGAGMLSSIKTTISIAGDKSYSVPYMVMLTANENFEPLYSTPAKARTMALNVFLLSLFALLLFGLLVMAVVAFQLKKTEYRLPVFGFTIVVLGLLIWLAFVTYQSSKGPHKFTHISVDATGMHHFTKTGRAVSLLYESLLVNNRGGIHDVLLTDMGYSEGDLELCVFIKDDSGAVRMQPIRFKLFLVPNGNALRAHFIKGIRHFRPDLKIDPQVVNVYQITS